MDHDISCGPDNCQAFLPGIAKRELVSISQNALIFLVPTFSIISKLIIVSIEPSNEGSRKSEERIVSV